MNARKISFYIFAFLCICIGLYPVIYFYIDSSVGLLSSKSEVLLSSLWWKPLFYIHIGFGGLSLLTGWSQFSASLRKKRIELHRKLGFVYLISVVFSGLSAVAISFYATGGFMAASGFFILAIIWLYTSAQAYYAVKRKDIDSHRIFMLYSFAACFAAVTLRIWLPLLSSLLGDFVMAYRIVAWLCWVPNIVIVWWFLRRQRITTSIT